MQTIEQLMAVCAASVEERIAAFMPANDKDTRKLWEAMRYSALSGGKRVRPFLAVETAKMLGGDLELATVFGVAIELIHTYSLVHDDLPCMDNDDFRRGRLTTHKKYGEATAVLAGDALLTLAFDLVLSSSASDKQKIAAASALSAASGAVGMIGGQIMDLDNEQRMIDKQTLYKLHSLKTGALLTCAVKLGCIASNCFEGAEYDAILSYADKIGVVFQIVDDILDQYGTVAIGKPMHSDQEKGKSTVLTVMTLDEAKAEAEKLTTEAMEAIGAIQNSKTLSEFATYLLRRQK